MVWACFADLVPLYPLYALLFADAGLSTSEISALFALWSGVAIVAEVPAGALADRFSRRGALVAAGLLQAAGYVVWLAAPGFPGFAVGFVLWGLGGSLVSGALEALLHDGLAAFGAEAHFPVLLGRVTAAGFLAELPTAAAAAGLFALGGYGLAGWVSVGACLVASGLAARLPEPPRERATDPDGDEPGYLATLRAGVEEAAARPVVRAAVLAVAVVGGIDALEEYFPLLVRDWSVPTSLNPLAVLVASLAGAAGAALGGRASGLSPTRLGLVLGAAAVALGAAGVARHPAGLAAVAVFWGLHQLVLIAFEARLQARIEGPARATVTSLAGLGTELTAFVVFAAWALGEILLVAALVAVVAVALAGAPRLGARSA